MPLRWIVLTTAMLSWTLDTRAAGEPHTPDKFEPEIRKFEVVDQRTPPPVGAILFTGSSSIRLWTHLTADLPGRTVLNRGFGGSQMSDLLHFFDRVVLPYHPAMIVVYEGDNDLADGKTVDAVFADFRTFLQRVQETLPDTSVALLAVKPSPARRLLLEEQRDLNRRLRELAAKEPRLSFIDTATPLLAPDGSMRPELYREDGLHLDADGYAIWRKAVTDAWTHRP